MSLKVNGDCQVTGTLACTRLLAPSGSIRDEQIPAGANIDDAKLKHRFTATVRVASGTAVTASSQVVHIAEAAGNLISAIAVTPTPATGNDRTVTVDVQKGNVGGSYATMLSATIVLDDDTNARDVVPATISGTGSYAAEDSFLVTVAVAGSAGNQAEGLLVQLTFAENPA